MNDTVTLLTRRAGLASSSANRDDRTVEVILSTGTPVAAATWLGIHRTPWLGACGGGTVAHAGCRSALLTCPRS